MKTGSLRCLGTSQHLKTRFGQGYELKIQTQHGYSETLLADVSTRYVSSTVLEHHGDSVTITTTEQIDLAATFAWLGELKSEGKVLDYAVSQTSLEQIFVSLAGDANTHIDQ